MSRRTRLNCSICHSFNMCKHKDWKVVESEADFNAGYKLAIKNVLAEIDKEIKLVELANGVMVSNTLNEELLSKARLKSLKMLRGRVKKL